MLWSGLAADERAALTLAHRQRYHALARYLYHEDRENPNQARAIACRELSNLLHAVHAALDAGDANAVIFVDGVNRLLNCFSMTREAALLTRRAEQTGGEPGSQAWFLATTNRGEQLLASGRVAEAAQIFVDILETLGEEPSYGRSLTLGRLGRCHQAGGRPDLAEAAYRQGIAVTERLEQTYEIKRHRGVLWKDLADVLMDQGKHVEAREQYEQSMKVVKELNDQRSQGALLGQLGTLAIMEGDLGEAAKRLHEAGELFRCLGEPAMEAVAQHQIGRVFEEARQWEQAEHCYREAARLREQHGDLVGAAQTWFQLARVNESAGKARAAETWYRKAIEVDRGNPKELAPDLSSLANLLRIQPGRLDEARELAEEALAIDQTLDPGAAKIWKTYGILAEIADQQSQPDKASKYRRLARQAKRSFAGTAHEIKQHLPVILGTLQALHQPDVADDFRAALSQREQHGWTNLVAAIHQVLSGERDADVLCESLDLEDSMIIETILAAITDPSTLGNLLPPD